MGQSAWIPVSPPRPMTSGERAILDFILALEFPGRDVVQRMLRDAEVVGECPCGCGTIDLTFERAGGQQTWTSPVPEEAVAMVEGHVFNAMLFVDADGASLEFVWYGEPASRLPERDELEPARWESGRLLNFDDD